MKKKEKNVFGEILTSLTRTFAVLVAAVTLFILLSGLRIVKSGEVALIYRFGKLAGSTYEEQVHEPGLLFAFPYIIDEVVIIPTSSVRVLEVTTHYTAGQMSGYTRNGYVISGDRNVILISAVVQYVVSDPVSYSRNVGDEKSLISATVSGQMVNVAAGMSSDALLTTGKLEFAENVKKGAGAILSDMNTGLSLVSVELTSVTMPQEVKDVYDSVNSAKVYAETLKEQPAQYRDTVIPSAEAAAQSMISSADAYRTTKVAEANSYLAEFRGVLEEYSRGSESVRIRLYNQKIGEIISKIGSIRFVDGGGSKIVIGGN